MIEIVERELGMSCLPLTLRAGRGVRKAVIPAAGFGTRLFPASKATKKELFPIVDRDGIAKPAILLLVEEALGAGMEEVIIVVQKEDLPEFRSFFEEQVTIENYNKLPRHAQEYARRILEMGRKVKFALQTVQEGFGHAVYAAREAVGDEPFLLMLGDHLYRSNRRKLRPAAGGCLQRARGERPGAQAHRRAPPRQLRCGYRGVARTGAAPQRERVRRKAHGGIRA